MITFNFGGKNSFNDYGIYISTRPTVPSPKRKITNVSIPGRNSSLIFDENTYEDITITVECTVKEKLLSDKIDEIKGWLLGSGESNLVFNFQDNKKYIAQVINTIDFSQVLRYFSKFIIVFNCKPFKYEVITEKVILKESATILNIGSIYSEPILNIIGSGDLELYINEEKITLKDIDGEVIIDSTTENCYNSEFENLNYKMNGEFPKLKVGENNITWSGNISTLEVTPNWRWL